MSQSKQPDSFDDSDIIHAYSREQAIADGVLVDITPTAKEAGYKVPVAITAAVRARLEPSEYDVSRGQSFEGRLWDVLMVLRSCAGDLDTDTVTFVVTIAEMDGQNAVYFKAHIGPGDSAEPVVTIMFPHED